MGMVICLQIPTVFGTCRKIIFVSQLDVYGVKNIGRIEIQLSRRHLNLVPLRLISALKDADHQLLITFQQN
jgi:hypothetical protein